MDSQQYWGAVWMKMYVYLEGTGEYVGKDFH